MMLAAWDQLTASIFAPKNVDTELHQLQAFDDDIHVPKSFGGKRLSQDCITIAFWWPVEVQQVLVRQDFNCTGCLLSASRRQAVVQKHPGHQFQENFGPKNINYLLGDIKWEKCFAEIDKLGCDMI